MLLAIVMEDEVEGHLIKVKISKDFSSDYLEVFKGEEFFLERILAYPIS